MLLSAMAADASGFARVERLGVDQHVWHQVSEAPITERGRGPGS
jgi:hypothetical protein